MCDIFTKKMLNCAIDHHHQPYDGQLAEARGRCGDSSMLWSCSAERGDIEAVEALMSMSSCWKARSQGSRDLRPLTPSSDVSEEDPLMPGSAEFQESPFCMTPPCSPPDLESAVQTAPCQMSRVTEEITPAPAVPPRSHTTSVIRHTADSLPCTCDTCPARQPEVQPCREQLPGEGRPRPSLLSTCPPALPPTLTPIAMPVPALARPPAVLAPVGVSPVPVLCHMLSVPSAPHPMTILSAPAPTHAPIPAPADSQPPVACQQVVLMRGQVPKGPVMFLVPQSVVPKQPPAAATPASSRLPAIAPAPGFIPVVQKSSPPPAESRVRSYVCAHPSCEKPFRCSWEGCERRFARSDELSRHRRTHTGEKRFACPLCQSRFMRSDHLTKHTRRHLAAKKLPYWQMEVSLLKDFATVCPAPLPVP
ncbi:hypothetical protein JZ751_023763 [Albula glossodonta]|uniref:C2H2-type domain-containing protein n=1 Tax=Albula glossodonta TaxID=121402 RepID=A0A8T2NJC1_9TELE|nr:hypothetical protein JZ751_023763 [Albula glossodonta]